MIQDISKISQNTTTFKPIQYSDKDKSEFEDPEDQNDISKGLIADYIR